jgi:inward rectifier potassium channel
VDSVFAIVYKQRVTIVDMPPDAINVTPRFDPGLTQQYGGGLKRAINRDGNFNVRRRNGNWRDSHPYLFLISISWPRFIGLVGAAFLVLNTLFALCYLGVGIDHLKNAEGPTAFETFLNAFFFSAHTLTTVGYGNMWPVGPWANVVAASESLLGVLAFAIATGLMFGRFSRPSARFGYSENALIAPYMRGTSLQFRVANRRSNNIINVDARVLLMTVEVCDGVPQRRFAALDLERTEILFFALTWTIVHPINEKSPLWGKTTKDLEAQQTEVIILMRGFDDTFGQNVHSRYSYRWDEIEWGARFAPAFEVEASGDLLIDLERIGSTLPAPLPASE